MDILQNGRERTAARSERAVVAFHLTAAQSLSGKYLGRGNFAIAVMPPLLASPRELNCCSQWSKKIVKYMAFKKVILNARKWACSCCYIVWIVFIWSSCIFKFIKAYGVGDLHRSLWWVMCFGRRKKPRGRNTFPHKGSSEIGGLFKLYSSFWNAGFPEASLLLIFLIFFYVT